MIRTIEELSFNAWPALQTVYHDGWLLRFAEGYTRRANSVQPLYESALDPDAKIAYCEAVYARKRQPTIFKLTDAAQPDDLDLRLEVRGYCQEALTSVQVLGDLVGLETPGLQSVTIENTLTEAWLEAFCRLNNVDARHVPAMKRMLAQILPQTGYLALHQGGDIAAVALAVLEQGYVGAFDVVVAARFRRQGLGTQLMLHLLHWARDHGAERAYLQVMCDNTPAQTLYHHLGYSEIYQYWYRVPPLNA